MDAQARMQRCCIVKLAYSARTQFLGHPNLGHCILPSDLQPVWSHNFLTMALHTTLTAPFCHVLQSAHLDPSWVVNPLSAWPPAVEACSGVYQYACGAAFQHSKADVMLSEHNCIMQMRGTNWRNVLKSLFWRHANKRIHEHSRKSMTRAHHLVWRGRCSTHKQTPGQWAPSDQHAIVWCFPTASQYVQSQLGATHPEHEVYTYVYCNR